MRQSISNPGLGLLIKRVDQNLAAQESVDRLLLEPFRCCRILAVDIRQELVYPRDSTEAAGGLPFKRSSASVERFMGHLLSISKIGRDSSGLHGHVPELQLLAPSHLLNGAVAKVLAALFDLGTWASSVENPIIEKVG